MSNAKPMRPRLRLLIYLDQGTGRSTLTPRQRRRLAKKRRRFRPIVGDEP